jgi:hypothetical protein
MAKIKIIHGNTNCSGDCAGCMSFQPVDETGMPECTRDEDETISREEAAKLPPAGWFTPEQVETALRRCEGCAWCAAFAEGACNGNR